MLDHLPALTHHVHWKTSSGPCHFRSNSQTTHWFLQCIHAPIVWKKLRPVFFIQVKTFHVKSSSDPLIKRRLNGHSFLGLSLGWQITNIQIEIDFEILFEQLSIWSNYVESTACSFEPFINSLRVNISIQPKDYLVIFQWAVYARYFRGICILTAIRTRFFSDSSLRSLLVMHLTSHSYVAVCLIMKIFFWSIWQAKFQTSGKTLADVSDLTMQNSLIWGVTIIALKTLSTKCFSNGNKETDLVQHA